VPAALSLLGLTWQRPWLALLLAVPALIWLLAARQERAVAFWTGTLALWRESAVAPARARPAGLPPRAVRYLVAALGAAVLALAGPDRKTSAGLRAWTVVVDRSPSMYLPWSEGEQRGGTRLERALALARQALDAKRAAGDSVTWIAYVDGLPERETRAEFPSRWLAPPLAPQAEPPWSRHDWPGALWVTDRTPSSEPLQAGWVACGGSAVPGFISARGTDRMEWDGERLLERLAAGPRPIVAIAPEIDGPAERALRSWADARGCEVVAAPSAGAVLEVTVERSASPGAALNAVLERDGWRWQVELTDQPPPPGETWLADQGDGRIAVAWQPGRLAFAAGRFEREPEGDPVDFALSWSELLDRAASPPEGVVALAERREAGALSEWAPSQARRQEDSGASSAAWLFAALAAILSAAALWQGRR
jgi:hypothetical protein